MANFPRSFSLLDFQQDVSSRIEDLKKSKEPILITSEGKVQAVLVHPDRFEEMEAGRLQERLLRLKLGGIAGVVGIIAYAAIMYHAKP